MGLRQRAPALRLDGELNCSGGPAEDNQASSQPSRLRAAAGGASKIIVYDDAGHAFFADYRPSYVRADAEASWSEATRWLKPHGV